MRAGAAADKAGANEAKAAARQAKVGHGVRKTTSGLHEVTGATPAACHGCVQIDEIRASHRRPKRLFLPPSAPHVPEEDELELSKRELQARLGNEVETDQRLKLNVIR